MTTWAGNEWMTKALPEEPLRRVFAKAQEAIEAEEDVAGMMGAPYVAIIARYLGELASIVHSPETTNDMAEIRDRAVLLTAAAARVAAHYASAAPA